MEALITNHVKGYVLTKYVMIQIMPRNRQLIDISYYIYLDLIDIVHVSRSPIYIFLCTVLVTLPRLGQISYHFDDSRTLQYTNAYMLVDQPFLIDSTTFPSQCNCMTITGLYL